MNWLRNQKIRTKLLVSLLLSSAIIGLIGYVGIHSLRQANESDTILFEKNTVPLALGGQISTAYQRQRTNVLEIIFAKDAALKADQEKRISDRDAEIDTLIREYEKTLQDNSARAIFNEFTTSLNVFKSLRGKVLTLVNQNNTDAALALYRNEMEAVRKNVQAAIEKLAKNNIQSANERANQNLDDAATTLNVMIIIVVVGLISAVLLGMFIAKMISNPARELLDATNKFAAGDMNVNVTYSSKDEIGELTAAFQNMIGKIALQVQYLDNLPSPVMIIDKEFSINYMNKTGAQIVAKDQKELIGQKCYDQFRTGHCRTENCALQKAMKFDKVFTEETIARPNGNELPVLYTGAPIKNRGGQVVGALEAVTDITDIKNMQNYLNRSTQTMLLAMDKFSNGDLTVGVKPEKENDEIGKLFKGFNKSVENIKSIIASVTNAVEATASASSQISSSTEEMAAGTQEQSSQAGEVAAAVQQMTATILESTTNANRAADFASKTESVAKEGGKVVQETISGMMKISQVVANAANTIQELGNSSEQIGEIVQVIDDIADQTNLLALNAAIEAARAGEQGRGFAVVADEVRKLAERTTKATKEIAVMIKTIQSNTNGAVKSINQGTEEVEKGTQLANKTGEAINVIITSIKEVTGEINQVAASSEELSSAAEQISKNIESISAVTNESAQGTQQIARAAEDLNRLTDKLQGLVEQFKMEEQSKGLVRG
jgi:methyl-accepting chemotaxis protein